MTTEQEKNPHVNLVDCRNKIEAVLKLTRSHAAAVCNRLSDEQVELILAAKDDAGEVQKIVEMNDSSKSKPPQLAAKDDAGDKKSTAKTKS